jgi:hypothetical protein
MISKKVAATIIVTFAKRNSFVINPLLGYGYFLKHYMEDHHCACAPERKVCPCPESIKEVADKGKCKCGLYFKNYDCWLNWEPAEPDKNIMQETQDGNNRTDS